MPVLLPGDPDFPIFPSHTYAGADGLLAVGGVLNTKWLLTAYFNGIFPWFSEGDPVLWWSPDPRSVIWLSQVKVPKSMRPYFNQKKFELKIDSAFEDVIEYCATVPRRGQDGTWITEEMKNEYIEPRFGNRKMSVPKKLGYHVFLVD